MGRSTASPALRSLERSLHDFSPGAADRKAALVRQLDRSRLASARAVERFHEALCFLRAYPDSAAVLTAAEQGLARFASRPDLRRWREQLEDTGIAGTDTYYRFYWPIAALPETRSATDICSSAMAGAPCPTPSPLARCPARALEFRVCG